MGRLSAQAKKATRKLKQMFQSKPHENSQFNGHPSEMVQRKDSPIACSAHQIQGCRCNEMDIYTFATKDASSVPSSDANTVSTVSLNSLALNGMENLGRCNKNDATTYSQRAEHHEIQDTNAGECEFSFAFGEPEHFSTPVRMMESAKHPTSDSQPVRQLPRLSFLELARATRQESQSQELDLKEDEEYELAPEEVGPLNYPYHLSYSNFTASPQVERRRSL